MPNLEILPENPADFHKHIYNLECGEILCETPQPVLPRWVFELGNLPTSNLDPSVSRVNLGFKPIPNTDLLDPSLFTSPGIGITDKDFEGFIEITPSIDSAKLSSEKQRQISSPTGPIAESSDPKGEEPSGLNIQMNQAKASESDESNQVIKGRNLSKLQQNPGETSDEFRKRKNRIAARESRARKKERMKAAAEVGNAQEVNTAKILTPQYDATRPRKGASSARTPVSHKKKGI